MDSSLIALMMLSLLLGCGCWLLFIWAVRDGQFTDIERPKHRMLDDEDSFPSRGKEFSFDPAERPLPDPPPPGLRAEALRSAKAGEGVTKGVGLRHRSIAPPPGGGRLGGGRNVAPERQIAPSPTLPLRACAPKRCGPRRRERE